MAQHDYIISNQGFPATRADINNVLNSIATLNSGTSAPATQYAGQMWIDTTTATAWILYIYDGADNIQIATINTSTNTVNFTDSALDVLTDTTPQLGGNLDVNGNSIVSTSNANITLAPDGTGDVVLSADTVKIGDANANATITTDGTGDLILNTNSGSSSGSITIADGANANITIEPNGTGDILLNADTVRVGDSGADATITSNGAGDLILNTNSGTNSGSITIADGANGNITIAGNGTSQIVVNAGAVGTPTITPTGDLNTGIFFPSADTIAFTEGGTEAMRIDSDGRVGIGTTTPTNRLEISSTGDALFKASRGTNDFSISLNNNVGALVYIGSSVASPLALMTTNTERMRIDSGGVVLIAGTSIYSGAGPELHVEGDIDLGNGGTATERELTFSRSATTGVIGRINSRIAGFSTMPMIEFGCTNTAGGDQAGDMKFYTTASATRALRMTIQAGGAVNIVGALSKGSGSFKIDHPLPEKKDTHHLVHSFTESPQADLIYRGKIDLVNGTATVNIDTVAGMTEGTFVLLNREVQCFTSNESGWSAVKGSVSGNILTINAQDNNCNDTISWLVIGERQDKHMYDTNWTDENGKVIVEPLKEIEEPEIIDNEFKLNWSIDNLDRKSSNGYVTTIHWRAIATEGKLNTSINGTVSFKDAEPIIPYENLTKETVLGWLFNNINKEEIETKVTEQLEQLKNPVVKSGLPWENN